MSVSIRFFCILSALALLAACETTPPIDRSALIDARPVSILVLPPLNHSVEVNASYTYLSTITRPIAEKGYYVFPVAVIDLFMKENGLPTPAEMNSVPLKKIEEIIDPDAVLYTEILDWGQKYQVISSKTIVHAKLRLVHTRTGELLWSGTAIAEKSNNHSDNGLAGALLGAVIDQIVGSLTDHTLSLSRIANTQLIRHPQKGLINGLYRSHSSSIEGRP